MEWSIRRYRQEDAGIWNDFVAKARNSTFLFQRGYMDYHSDRFHDCSWMAYKGNTLMAILPANIDEDMILHSHQGLTYGGWILPPAHLDGAGLLEIFNQAVDVWREEGIKRLDYKPLPYIYSARPSEEDIYALFRLGAHISEINLSAAINLREPVIYNKLRRRSLKKASSLPFIIKEMSDAGEFMSLVTACLRERHDTAPVHMASEICLLMSRFPDNIKLYGLRLGGNLEAAVMVYDTGRVAHAQYIASTPKGRSDNLLTPLFDYLIRECYAGRKYFDFGISNEDHGRYLNEGLLRQKYSYGATGVVYARYELVL